MRHIADIVREQRPVTLPADASVRTACETMRRRKVGAVLVVDAEDCLIGIFTGRDAVGRVLANGLGAETTVLAEVMTEKPRVMAPERPAIEALRLMQSVGCRHVPIVDKGKLLGVVSRADFRGLELDRLDEETQVWDRI